jgi:lysophospholipase L1-like esterase
MLAAGVALCVLPRAPLFAQTAPAPPAAKPTGPDWANLGRYHDANLKLPPPARGENRVVFIGASIMEFWGHRGGEFFPGKPYVNRGISGQTSSQVLVRFRQDVVSLKPKVVMINVGVNDIAGNAGYISPAAMEDNYMSMVDLARANGIRVVLSSITPAKELPWVKGLDPRPAIREVNAWMKDYAAKNGIVYLDYFSALADAEGGFKDGLSLEGVHPNAAGYAVMAPLAEKAIQKALKKR